MADRFLNPINLPIISAGTPAGAGYVRIYGKGTDAYAMFPDGTEKILSASGDVIIVSGDDVTRENLRYDNYERAVKATESASSIASVTHQGKRAVESVTAALAAEVSETGKRAIEKATGLIIGTANELSKLADESVSSEFSVGELGKRAFDTTSFETTISEQAKRAAEDISNEVIATASESAKRAEETISAVITARTEVGKKATTQITVNVTLNGYANQNVSNTGWTNQANTLGNTTNTSASLTATASGLAGTTNNTTTGTTVLGFRDVNLGDMTISNVILSVENSGAAAGVAVAQPTVSLQYQYSLNNGGTWTTFYSHTTPALAKGIRTVDISAIVGQDQSLLSALQIRATGQVTSGTGLGAGYTASFFRAWLSLSATRNY